MKFSRFCNTVHCRRTVHFTAGNSIVQQIPDFCQYNSVYLGVVYLLYVLYFKLSCVYCCELSYVYCCSCLVCIVVNCLMCIVVVVLCVLL